MSCASPIFISQNRFGTYYFRCRIPQAIKNHYQTNKAEVKKSLGTKDYRQAINSARRLWVYMIDNDFFLSGNVNYNTVEGSVVRAVSNTEPTIIQPENHKKLYNVNLLSDVVDKFCDETRLRWSATYEEKEFRPIISLLTEVIGDKPCSSIDSQDIVKFKEIYSQLPRNRKKIQRYRKKSVSELHKINIPAEDRLSIATIKKTFNILITFISWCSDNDYLSGDLAKPLQRFNKQNVRDTPEYEERDPFSNDDLKKIFESKEYLSGTHRKASEQWIPLISLFSGCRLRECYWVFRRKRPVALPRKRPLFRCENSRHSGENGQGVRVSHGEVFLSFHRFGFLVKH